MRSGKNIVKLCAALVASVTALSLSLGCQTANIPNVRVFREIPFVDGAEAVYINSATHEDGWVSAKDWAEKRPFMIMIDPEGWSQIKIQWYEACRYAGEKCNVTVDSVDSIVRKLDEITRIHFGGKK